MDSHEAWCSYKAKGHSDAAKRMSDTYNLHRIVQGLDSVGRWFAASLARGSSDGVLYDSKWDCVLHQGHNESYYVFIKIVPCGMNPCEAEVMLSTARRMYDKGIRMPDPDHKHGGLDLISRISVEDQLAQMKGIVTNLLTPWRQK